MAIRWHGQSFFEIITTAGTRIVLDPHAIEQYGRKSVKADIVLISHLHDDHSTTTAVDNIKQIKSLNALKQDPEDRRRVDWNILDEKFKDLRIRTVGTYHDEMSGLQRGKNGVFVIEVDGLRIVHLGDLGHTLSDAQIRRIGEVDILMIPVGGVYTINSIDASRVVEQLKPKRYILPMHYGTIVYDYLLKVDGFLEDQNPEAVKKFRTNEILIDPKLAPPKEPVIAVLHWSGPEKEKDKEK